MSDGSRYEGEWKEDKLEGFAINYDKYNKIKYIGEYKNDLMEGYLLYFDFFYLNGD